MEIRPYRRGDLNDLYAIALATGLAGADASSLYRDPKLMGHIYAAPYAVLTPERTWVAVDEEGVCGYVVGADDTQAWEDQLEEEWWPALRQTYANPDDERRDLWTADDRRIRTIFSPERTPAHVTVPFPAHVHLNLLPRMQRKGVGTSLLDLWLSMAAGRGVEAVHVAVNRRNVGGLHFWRRQGCVEIKPHHFSERTRWFGLRITRA